MELHDLSTEKIHHANMIWYDTPKCLNTYHMQHYLYLQATINCIEKAMSYCKNYEVCF